MHNTHGELAATPPPRTTATTSRKCHDHQHPPQVLCSARPRRHAPKHCKHLTIAAASGSNQPENEDDLQKARQQLNALFYQLDTTSADNPPPVQLPLQPPSVDTTYPSLPLWRVQWAALPGCTETLNVHVPHYAHMFMQLASTPKPWRFGHIYLPGGSTNLGNSEYALQPGTGAPLLGTLMEIQRLVQLLDGRLLIIARGVARIRVVRETQELPYARADCVLHTDEEERTLWQDDAVATAAAAMDDAALGDAQAAVAIGRMAHDVDIAAGAAAAAAAGVWCCWEVAREDLGLGAPRVVVCQSKDDELQAASALRHLEAGVPFPEVESSQSDVVLHATRAAADNAAHLAMSTALQRLVSSTQEPLVWPTPPLVINSVAERGGPCLTPPDDQDEKLLNALTQRCETDGLAGLHIIEKRLWQELDALWSLGSKVSPRPLPVPHAIRSLRPPAVGGGGFFGTSVEDEEEEEEKEGGGGTSKASVLPELPEDDAGPRQGPWLIEALSACTAEGGPRDASTSSGGESSSDEGASEMDEATPNVDGLMLLRLQRLSYMLVLLMPEVSASEGRQGVLEMPSITSRLLMVIGSLRRQRRVLAAVAALKGLGDEEPPPLGA